MHVSGRFDRDAVRLSLAELEPATRALLSVLLAFLHTRVAGQESVLAQRRTQLRVQLGEGARNAHAHRSGLAADAATLDLCAHLDLIEHLRKFQRLDRGGVPRDVAKIIVNRAIVPGELRRSGFDVDARYGLPA